MDSITEGGQLLEEPRLSACLVLARSLLYTRRTELNDVRPAPKGRHAHAMWNTLANSTARFISCRQASEHFASPESNPFKQLSHVFHSFLILAVHLVNMRDKGIESVKLLELAARRFAAGLAPIRTSIRADTVTLLKLDELAQQYALFQMLSMFPRDRFMTAIQDMY